MNRRSFLAGAATLVATPILRGAPTKATRLQIYVGTRATGKDQGIYSCSLDLKTGACSPLAKAIDFELPTTFTASADGKILYSVNETGNDGKTDGGVAAFSIERPSGKLALLNRVTSGGGGPTIMTLDRTGRTLLVANFGSGKTTAVRVLPDGRLGELTASMQHAGTGPHRRQNGPHAHGVAISPDNHFVVAPEFGGDRIYIFHFDSATGALSPQDPPFITRPAGSGPRLMGFHPKGKFVYLLSELNAQLTTFAWDAPSGKLTELQTIPALAPEAKGEPSGAGLAIHPSGRFLYTTTRTDDAIELFAIDPAKGTLTLRQRIPSPGKSPWSCSLDPSGRYLFVANNTSNSLSVLRADPRTGMLTPATTVAGVPVPVAVIAVPV